MTAATSQRIASCRADCTSAASSSWASCHRAAAISRNSAIRASSSSRTSVSSGRSAGSFMTDTGRRRWQQGFRVQGSGLRGQHPEPAFRPVLNPEPRTLNPDVSHWRWSTSAPVRPRTAAGVRSRRGAPARAPAIATSAPVGSRPRRRSRRLGQPRRPARVANDVRPPGAQLPHAVAHGAEPAVDSSPRTGNAQAQCAFRAKQIVVDDSCGHGSAFTGGTVARGRIPPGRRSPGWRRGGV